MAETPPPAPDVAPVNGAEVSGDDSGDDNGLALAGLLGLVALGGAGLWAAGRRRRGAMDEPVYVEPVQTAPAASPPARLAQPGTVTPVPVRTAEPVATAPAMRSEDFHAPAAITRREAVNPSDREAVLAAMVDAAPSEENPFTSRKARMRRARLILQGREARGEPLTGLRKGGWQEHQPLRTGQLVDA